MQKKWKTSVMLIIIGIITDLLSGVLGKFYEWYDFINDFSFDFNSFSDFKVLMSVLKDLFLSDDVIAAILSFIGYVLVLVGLTRLANVFDADSKNAREIRKVRTAVIIIMVMVPVVWFLDLTIILKPLRLILSFIMTLVVHYMMKGAWGRLAVSDTFGSRGCKAAENLSLYSSFVIKVMWLPIIAGLLGALFTFAAVAGRAKAANGFDFLLQGVGSVLGLLIIPACLALIIFLICAIVHGCIGWIRMYSAWKTIPTTDNVKEVSSIVESTQEEKITEPIINNPTKHEENRKTASKRKTYIGIAGIVTVVGVLLFFVFSQDNTDTHTDTGENEVKEVVLGVTEAKKSSSVEKNAPQYLSSDLKAFGLYGKVKSVDTDSDDGIDLSFDMQGRLVSFADFEIRYDNQSKPTAYKNGEERKTDCDKQGRIISIYAGCGDYTIKYNSEGFLQNNQDGEYCTGHPYYTHYYDKSGQETRCVYSASDVGYGEDADIKFSDYKFDSHGNWKSRNFVKNIKESVYDESDGTESVTNNTKQGIERRSIIYY